MAIQLTVEYSDIIELIEQLSDEQQQDLITQIMTLRTQRRPLSPEEKIQLLDAAKLHNPVNETPSIRRSDWYNDDGR